MLHMFLSYCKSHIYDIHSLLVGTIIFFLIYVWRGQIDKMIENRVNKRYADGGRQKGCGEKAVGADLPSGHRTCFFDLCRCGLYFSSGA